MKRQAFADDLTDGQIKFLFYAQQERERMKKENAEKNTPNTSSF
jgi:hypothetical protein